MCTAALSHSGSRGAGAAAVAGPPPNNTEAGVSGRRSAHAPASKSRTARQDRGERREFTQGVKNMRGVVLHAPGDVGVEERDDPKILYPTDAIIRLSATCICGSDLWPYRGIEAITEPTPMGHEYAGVVEQVGSEVKHIRVGDFVVGSFFASDNTCEICQAGYQSRCVHAELMGSIGTQSQRARVPLADGTLVATPDIPSDDLIPSLLAAS